MQNGAIRVLVVGVGNMGLSHALAYGQDRGFEIVGLCSRSIRGRNDLPAELASLPRFEYVDEALAESRPDAVSINTYPNTHEEFCLKAFDAGCHVFVEKPLATTVEGAQAVVDKARATGKKLVIGYILRVHPAWKEFIARAQTLGKPLVMRMNLNQQSRGPAWNWHRNLMESLTPIVDCGVHYVDVMCQMTGAQPVRVHGVGAQLTDQTKVQNYGPPPRRVRRRLGGLVRGRLGPDDERGRVLREGRGGTQGLRQHRHAAGRAGPCRLGRHRLAHQDQRAALPFQRDRRGNNFVHEDEWVDMADEPTHQELCDREQEFLLKAIREDLDLSEHMDSAVNSLRIVIAADESIKRREVVHLA